MSAVVRRGTPSETRSSHPSDVHEIPRCVKTPGTFVEPQRLVHRRREEGIGILPGGAVRRVPGRGSLDPADRALVELIRMILSPIHFILTGYCEPSAEVEFSFESSGLYQVSDNLTHVGDSRIGVGLIQHGKQLSEVCPGRPYPASPWF
jgi:hypothetical protein